MILVRKPGSHFSGIMLQKIRGRRRGTPPPPIRPGPVGGHGEGRGRVGGSRDGLLHPSPGFAPPTGATIAGGTPRTFAFRARIQAGASINRVPAELRGTACSHPT